MRSAYRSSTRVVGLLIAVLGVAMVVVTVAQGGGPLAFGVVLGVLFTAMGIGRFVLAGAGRSGPER